MLNFEGDNSKESFANEVNFRSCARSMERGINRRLENGKLA
jgi:hypothetical protein